MKYSVEFLKNSAATFHLMNIHEIDFQRTKGKTLGEKIQKTLQDLEDQILNLASYSPNPKHQFKTIFSSENLINAVRRSLQEYKIDLIFIGTRSQQAHSHPLFGDHAYELVRKIKCNIFAIPTGCKFKKPEKAVFPVDDSLLPENYKKDILEKIEYFRSLEFTLMEISNNDSVFKIGNKESHPVRFTKKLFRQIQKQYDFIFIIGKNLNLCDRLLHSEYGFSAKMPIHIPIYVYHG